jgi:hypothetical protein
MTQIDQFESVFNAAAKETYHPTPLALKDVLIVTDLDDDKAEAFLTSVKKFLSVLPEDTRWTHRRLEDEEDVDAFFSGLEKEQPDLIVTYRNLQDRLFRWPYSLGVWLTLLMRKTNPPVLVVPHPFAGGYEWAGINTDRVMVVTDHLTGDNTLVDYGVAFTEPGGKLYLSHIEDDGVFDRYIEVIGKIAQLDTDQARELIKAQLLKEPHDYIRSVASKIGDLDRPLDVVETVVMGHRVDDYRRLVEAHEVDLLVFRTEDESDTLAMHGIAYSLAVELRRLPLLML